MEVLHTVLDGAQRRSSEDKKNTQEQEYTNTKTEEEQNKEKREEVMVFCFHKHHIRKWKKL